jgi:hypothetical protein
MFLCESKKNRKEKEEKGGETDFLKLKIKYI